MTFSLVARDAATGACGIAVASRFFAVGAVVPHMSGGHGAIATQAFVSPLYGTEGLALLKAGRSAGETLASVTGGDRGRQSRQVHMIDAAGRGAAFTGDLCIDWCGHLLADNVSAAGNMLAGPGVLDAAMEAYHANPELPFEERLLTAMEAGEQAGGDKRGRQSAALRIVRTEDYPWLDIRTDDHGDPLGELRRLLAVARERYLHFAELLPTRANIHGATDRTEIDRRIAALDEGRKTRGEQSASYASDPL